jgi:hypothetical protein
LRPGSLIAISASNVQGVYFSPQLRGIWRQILDHSALVDTVGYSIFIYEFRGGMTMPPPVLNSRQGNQPVQQKENAGETQRE